ncbi:MAG: phycobiliprotein lyase [Microcystaceae cyanobacterium]
MDIHSFLSQCAGQWFSQRSLYDFSQQVADHQKSELTVETLFSAGEEIQSLLQTTPFQADQVVGALKLTWDTSVDWGKPKQTGSQWYLFLASEQPNRGQLWRSPTTSGEPAGQGSYALNPDESLGFALNLGEFQIEERHWFASPNLRFRTSLILHQDQFSHSAFYSEIRKLPPNPTPQS